MDGENTWGNQCPRPWLIARITGTLQKKKKKVEKHALSDYVVFLQNVDFNITGKTTVKNVMKPDGENK